jgi:hypothetical protein
MAQRSDDRCGARVRRPAPAIEPHLPETQGLGLTPLGAAFLDALRDDERFRDLIADPFGDHGPNRGTS